jgi:ankyrin repeat/BTB/POZ domain-containing protein 1
LQPLASHIYSLLTRSIPKTSDISLTAGLEVWNLHKFILSARSPYFQKKLMAAPETAIWRLASTIPPEAFQIALRYLYLGDVPSDLGLNTPSVITEEEVLTGIDKVSKQLEIESLWEGLLSGNDRRLARQRHQDEVTRGRDQLESWYRKNVLKYKISVDSRKAADVKWTRDNGIFADFLMRSDADDEAGAISGQETPKARYTAVPINGIPIGPLEVALSPSPSRKPRESVLFPVHRAMLLRSEYFQTMFTSSFQEAQLTEYLHIVKVDCSPAVLEIVLDFLYTEKADIPIELALDVLYAADMLFIEKLKTKATIVISTIGNGPSTLVDRTHTDEGEDAEMEPINIYDVIRAGWFLKVQRLEEFSARYLAYRLEDYIDDEEFEELIMESAQRIEKREETDTIELLDEYVSKSCIPVLC